MDEEQLTTIIKRLLKLSFVDYPDDIVINFYYQEKRKALHSVEIVFVQDFVSSHHVERFKNLVEMNNLFNAFLEHWQIKESEMTLDLSFVGEN